MVEEKKEEKIEKVRFQFDPHIELDCSDNTVYGNQIGSAYNAYYKDKIFHPLFCFEGKTGDCLKASLKRGTDYFKEIFLWILGAIQRLVLVPVY